MTEKEVSVPEESVAELMREVMRIQKRYAHQLQGIQTERREEVRKALNNVAGRVIPNED